LVRSVSAHNWYEVHSGRQRLCEDLTPLLRPSDRLVFANDQNPDVLFCVAHKGWLLRPDQSTITDIRALAALGASIVIAHAADAEVVRGLEAMGQRLTASEDFAVFRIGPAQ